MALCFGPWSKNWKRKEAQLAAETARRDHYQATTLLMMGAVVQHAGTVEISTGTTDQEFAGIIADIAKIDASKASLRDHYTRVQDERLEFQGKELL